MAFSVSNAGYLQIKFVNIINIRFGEHIDFLLLQTCELALSLCEPTAERLQHLRPAQRPTVRVDALQFVLAEQHEKRLVGLVQFERLFQVALERQLIHKQFAAMNRVLALFVQKVELCEMDQTEVSKKLLHNLTILIG